jgi:hypothetical protein
MPPFLFLEEDGIFLFKPGFEWFNVHGSRLMVANIFNIIELWLLINEKIKIHQVKDILYCLTW